MSGGTMSTQAPALELDHVAIGHSARPLVRDIDLVVHPGEVLVLIGPNGSGKTTLLRTIAGLLVPLAGTISICGTPAATMSPRDRARTVAALFTERPRTELLTCKDIVEAGRYPYTGGFGILGEKDEDEVKRCMEATGCWTYRGRDFAHMSDGQRQRALIARALCQQPRVLILDEPTSYLDIRAQLDMLGLLRRYARERNVAIIASLHDIGLAQKAADTVVCIHDGAADTQGSPAEVFCKPRIASLYGLEPTAYNDTFGSFELERAASAARVFVVAGGGTGATCFRTLQRASIPFAAGVLHRHDVDGMLADSLAAHVVYAKDLEPVDDDDIKRAKDQLARCEVLICCSERFGTIYARNDKLVEHAHALGMPVYPTAEAYLAARPHRS